MALSDWLPPYWRDTLDFQQIKLALDDGVQPIMDFVEYFFGMCANASSWPDEVLTEVLLKCGYPEAGNASRERKQELIRRALRTRGLITDQVFVHYLKDAFDIPYEDPWPYGLVINRANMHVDVVVPCEDCSDGMRPINDAESFRYDNLMSNLQYSFPAGVALELRCDMPAVQVDRYYGAVVTTVIEINSTLNIDWNEVSLYDGSFNDYEGEYHPFEGWRINGTIYATERELNNAGYYVEYVSPVYLADTRHLTIQRWDGYVDIQGINYFDTWYTMHNQYGFTDHPTDEITVYDRNDGWNLVPAYSDPESGEYFVIHQWFVDEATMNANGYYLNIPAVGLEYGTMTSSADVMKGIIPSGTVGPMRLDFGNLVDSGNVPYDDMPGESRVSIICGVDAVVPRGSVKAESEYYWFYHFTAGSSLSNLWTPLYYADSTNPTNPDPSAADIPSAYYENVWLWDGSNIVDLNGISSSFRFAVYSSMPEFYTSLNTSVTNTACGCVIEPNDPNVFPGIEAFSLPNDLYTISGTTITWNTSHALYNIFYGKTVTIVYY